MRLPSVGLGTYKMNLQDLQQVLEFALIDCNYPLIDTARAYCNEAHIGQILESLSLKLPRSEYFITSKLAPRDQGFESTINSVKASLAALKTDFIDLYLIHWPNKQGLSPSDWKANSEARKQSWLALEQCQRKGLIRHIGISNYTERHIQELLEYATIKPAVNQFEIHPLYFPEQTIKACIQAGITIQAYSSFAEARLLKEDALTEFPVLQQIATKHHKEVSQVLLKWAVQQGFCVIPKSCNKQRVKENINLDDFTLDLDEMQAIHAIRQVRTEKFCWDPYVGVPSECEIHKI
jgi:diketogulonate reductase-like aldo/keto reductase